MYFDERATRSQALEFVVRDGSCPRHLHAICASGSHGIGAELTRWLTDSHIHA
jgi:hypothetical protein